MMKKIMKTVVRPAAAGGLVARMVVVAGVVAVAAIVLPLNALADEKSDAILAVLKQKMAAWGDYRVEFAVSIDGQSVAGSYEVSGESYHVTTPEIELFCDGRVKWEVNLTNREVTVDQVDPNDKTVMGNPTRLFDFLDGSYARRYIGPALIDGVECERIELAENVLGSGTAGVGVGSGAQGGQVGLAGSGGQKIDVFISNATKLPVRVGYTIGFMNTEARVDVVRITPRVTLDNSFKFNQNRYQGFEIIDFRP